MQFAGFIQAISKPASGYEVFDLVCYTAAPLGYDKIGLFALTPEAREAATTATGRASPIVISNYADTFTEAYLREQRHEIDPVLPLARETIAPLVWDEIVGGKTLTAEQIALLVDRRDAGIHNEITCPIHAPQERMFALRFARGSPGPCEREHLSTLQVLAIHFYYAFVKVWDVSAETPGPREGLADNAQTQLACTGMLSQREQQVLVWTARGKSASSISLILELSENTVNFYVKNAMRKLGTTNRVVAVVLAVRSGLIRP